ncbi:uncharacterized protein [Rutidosis leptorrhynchoides]|uniref:uncharacterized protein n=1 Tax=Rutidosis leptorrhynchoides TaxID=125765 RepID=UPI003A99F9F4
MYYLKRDDVFYHLLNWGFRSEYLKWVYNGEGSVATSSNTIHNGEDETAQHDMHNMLNDLFPTDISCGDGLEEGDTNTSNDQPIEIGRNKLDDLLKDAEKQVYPNSKVNKLSCVVHLYHIKCLNGWSNKSFSMLLEFLSDLLPEGNLLPKTTQQVKKMMSNLGLGYVKIHSCPNGCMLFWEENENKANCSTCGSSRWKVSENPQEETSLPKKKASKILRWFPLKPRLQRLFMSSKTTNLMKWHHDERIKDGKLRHPADALAWKHFDQKYPEFASDPRNVRLCCPGNKIDVYMQPLIKELKELWEVGVETYDASTKQIFQMKAALLCTISDFPGYANLSGWSTKGERACPSCGFDTDSKWLTHGRKWCYMCHRRWLSTDHPWRRDTRSFMGGQELRVAPICPSGEQVLQQLDDKGFLVDIVDGGPWKKKSIFFMLPYWEHLLLRHNLDVMHIEKNVCDNIVGTILGQEGKSKDNYKARLDLQHLGIRKELHLKKRPRSDTTFMPKACYQMTRDEKIMFLNTLKLIKPPDEFSSNISGCVQLNDRKLIGLKSYDCHMLMQEYLPIALRGTLPDHVSSVIIELCDFFRIICYKDLSDFDIQFLDSKVAVTLCKMEKIFPPSFFTVMAHLVIHLVKEVKLGGPVAFRWMYPIERDLHTLKSYVNNRAHPEGSIAEGYLAQESLTFCSRYLKGVETIFTRSVRNDDNDDNEQNEQNELEESNNFCPGRPLGRKSCSRLSIRKRSSNSAIDEISLAQAHRYVLFNVDSVTPFREEHKGLIKRQTRSRRIPEYEVEKIHCQQFSEWFQKRVARMEVQGDQSVTEEIKWLARGPVKTVKRYSGYLVKGYRFHTKKREKYLKTQNSGVVVTVEGASYASSRDRRPVNGTVNYYGKLNDIIQLNYSGLIRVILFKCDWVDINRGCKIVDGVKLVNFSYKTHTGANITDDPFVLASQVDKVFYAIDPKNKDWEVVRHVKLRDVFDMGAGDDQVIGYPNNSTSVVPNLHRIGDDGDDGMDVTEEMDLDVNSDEENEND